MWKPGGEKYGVNPWKRAYPMMRAGTAEGEGKPKSE